MGSLASCAQNHTDYIKNSVVSQYFEPPSLLVTHHRKCLNPHLPSELDVIYGWPITGSESVILYTLVSTYIDSDTVLRWYSFVIFAGMYNSFCLVKHILKLLIFLLLTSCECRWILPCTFIFLYHLLVWDISWFCVMLKDLLSEVHYSRWEHSNWWQCEWGSWERSANIKDVGIPTALQLKLVCNSDITCSAWFERLLVPQTSKNKCVE